MGAFGEPSDLVESEAGWRPGRKFCSIGARCNVYVYAPITMMSISYSFASSISKNSLDPLLSAQEFCDLVTLHEEFRASYVIFKIQTPNFITIVLMIAVCTSLLLLRVL